MAYPAHGDPTLLAGGAGVVRGGSALGDAGAEPGARPATPTTRRTSTTRPTGRIRWQPARSSSTARPASSAISTTSARYIASRQSRADGTIGAVDSFAQLGAADACGALGPRADPGGRGARSQLRAAARGRRDRRRPGALERLRDARLLHLGNDRAERGQRRARGAGVGGPGRTVSGCAVAAGARDYLLGRNPFGRSFVVGYGPKAPRHPHHWASVFGKGLPKGAVVGGPAPLSQVRGQGFRASSPFDSRFATYEDVRRDYVTSEPALDYAASSILLLAAFGHTVEHGKPPRRRDQPLPAPAQGQPGRLVPVGRRGARARASSSTGRSCSRSATRRATGAT